MRGPRIVGPASPALAFLRDPLARGPRSMDLGAPRPIEAKRRKSLILKDFPRIAAAGFSAEDKDHVSNKHWSFFFICKIFKNFY
jgi:hypothetical protein